MANYTNYDQHQQLLAEEARVIFGGETPLRYEKVIPGNQGYTLIDARCFLYFPRHVGEELMKQIALGAPSTNEPYIVFAECHGKTYSVGQHCAKGTHYRHTVFNCEPVPAMGKRKGWCEARRAQGKSLRGLSLKVVNTGQGALTDHHNVGTAYPEPGAWF